MSTVTEPGTLSTAMIGMPSAAAQADERGDVVVVAHVLVPVGDHRAALVPAALADDVHLGGPERVRAAHDRADVHVVLPVLDRHVERMPRLVEVGDDRRHRPVAVAVDDVAAVAVGEELTVVDRVRRPVGRVAGPGPDAHSERGFRLGGGLGGHACKASPHAATPGPEQLLQSPRSDGTTPRCAAVRRRTSSMSAGVVQVASGARRSPRVDTFARRTDSRGRTRTRRLKPARAVETRTRCRKPRTTRAVGTSTARAGFRSASRSASRRARRNRSASRARDAQTISGCRKSH